MELEASHYGQVQIISGIFSDGYVLTNQKTVLSERGTADLLNMDHAALIRMVTKTLPKTLKPFYDNNLGMVTKQVMVAAENSPYKGRKICVYTSEMVENLIFSYATAFAHCKLRPKQQHIGQRCVLLLKALVRTALDTAIKEACGLTPQIQETARKHYNAIEILQEEGYISSLPDDISIKKDLTEFLNVPDATLNSFLRKHKENIHPITLDVATIRSLGSRANRMHGYSLEDVTKIVFGMDTDVSLKLKRRMFGEVGSFSKPHSKNEIEWYEFLMAVFEGFTVKHNFPFGKYKIDYLIPEFSIALELNGYAHKHYNPVVEARREKLILREYALIRFHHQVRIEVLFNAILRAKVGEAIVLYDPQHLC